MLDISSEGPDYLSKPLTLSPDLRLLCLAPHPDDEVIGCGGTLMLAQQAGAYVHVAVLCDGAQGLDAEPVQLREEESRQAARQMGLPEPDFLRWPDRQLRYAPPLVERVLQLLEAHRPTWLLLPSLAEPHPDHQALALAATEAARQWPQAHGLTLLYCEIGAPATPNAHLDISAVAQRKWDAMAAFASQEARHPYARHAQALGTLRALGVGPQCEAAEAFWVVPASQLHALGPAAVLPYWPLQRRALGLATDASELPLVSVLVRSMSRPCLADALASVAAQTYPNIEVVVLNATGQPHAPIAWPEHRLALRLVNPPGALDRSAAANAALAQAQGSLALFLDDDDLLAPEHLAHLVNALQQHPKAVASHTGVQVLGQNGELVRVYDTPWSPERLAGINFLPIHAVLFRMAPVRQHQLRFDESLPVLEDWDFWCQLDQHGPMVHVPGCTGIYRQGLGQSHLGQAEHPHHWRRWHQQLLQNKVACAPVEQVAHWLGWHALALDQATAEREAVQRQQAQAIAELQARHQDLLDLYAEREAVHRQQTQAMAELQARHQELLATPWVRLGKRLGSAPTSAA